MSYIKVDIGCGTNKKKGYIGIDKYKTTGADIVVDVEHSNLPFKDNTVDNIRAYDFLEHIGNTEKVMSEIYRVLKPNACVNIEVPFFRFPICHQPLHKRYFSWTSFHYWMPDDFPTNRMMLKGGPKFKLIRQEFVFRKGDMNRFVCKIMKLISKRNPYLYENIFSIFFPANGINIEMKKIQKEPDEGIMR